MMRFDEATLRRLESLRLAVRRAVRGRGEGDRSAGRRGGASEFVAHRAYAPGDDFRAIDWQVYARLGQLFVRERAREERLTLHLAFDTSPSMAVGSPAKLDQARRVAAGLAAAAFAESGRVVVWGAGGGRAFESLGSLLSGLETPPAAPGPLLRALRLGARERGIVAFFSDLWDEDLREPLLASASAGDVAVLHLLAPDEADPPPLGRVRFADAETEEEIDRFVGEEETSRYRTLLAEHCESWKRWCREHGMSYVRFGSDAPWEEIVTGTLREAGVLE
ncbi:MAG: DUF58 domain-containing protein [Planctomycetes bacterium]|nr:DUF58 domain-containing protein [Planctomycetota bacterium]